MDLLEKDVRGAVKMLIEEAVLLRSNLGISMEERSSIPSCKREVVSCLGSQWVEIGQWSVGVKWPT
jgi:hypothetical protein